MAGTIITKKGLQLIAKLVASGTAMTFSRVSVGTGAVPAGYDPGSMTDLNQYKMDGSISSCSFLGDEASIIMQISSLGVETGFTITETGLFATDPDEGEILYAYLDLTKDPQYVYAENSAISKFVEITLVVKVGTVERVTAQLNPRSLLTRDGDISDTSINDLEPIDTKYPVPSAGESTKVFLGKVKKYIEDTKPLNADMAVYVATTGSDTLGDGTSAKPYQTINYALSTIPKNLRGYVATIFVADGTYDEAVFISGFTNGSIRLRRNGNIELNSLCNISSVKADSCDTVIVYGINFTASNVIGVHMSRCNYSNIYFCQSIASAVGDVASFAFDYVSTGYITDCKSLYHTVCLKSYLSTVVSSSWVDSLGSVNGFHVDGGQITKGNIFQPKGSVLNESYVKGSIVSSVFGASVGTLAYDLTLFVSPTGSDTTGTGSAAQPFKTIQRAIDILPRDFGGYNATIIISAGTYDNDLVLSGLGNNGVLSLVLAGDITVKSITTKQTNVIFNSIDLTARSLTTQYLYISDNSAFNAYSSVYITTTGFVEDSGSKFSIFILKQSTSYISGVTTLTGNVGTAIGVTNLSKAYFYSTNGSGFAVGLALSTGSQLTCYSNTLSASTPVQQVTGGMIINNNGTQISNMITSGLSCTWGTIAGGYIRHGNFNGTAMITVMLTITLSASLSTGTVYSVLGFPQPIIGVAACSSPQWLTSNCYLGYDRVLRFTPNQNFTPSAGSSISVNCTYLTNS